MKNVANTHSNPKTSSDTAASPDTTRLTGWLDKYQSPEIAETYIRVVNYEQKAVY
jgi:hypothetical protein